ncbi:MAG: hypothetical protein M5R42_12675 [Rhodocyclaceae bacterium]|nr:hypothetical protein [Rhodocyclaceae bacterium]
MSNFTLPIARAVVPFAFGVEGSQVLVSRAEENAARTDSVDSTALVVGQSLQGVAELLATNSTSGWSIHGEGAIELVGDWGRRIRSHCLFCNPATLGNAMHMVLVYAGAGTG